MSWIKRFIMGTLIGIGAIVPGASGGAIAMVTGLYNQMVESISGIFKSFKKNLLFLIPIGLGAAIGVVLFSNVQKGLLENYPMQTMFCFGGLIIGTIPALFKKANEKGEKSNKNIIAFIITLLVSLVICYVEYRLDNNGINIAEKAITLNFPTILYLLLAGFIMAGSLVIPGVSGTVLMIIIGAYGMLLNAVASIKDIIPEVLKFQFSESTISVIFILGFLVIGLAIGGFVFSVLMKKLLNKYYTVTYYAVLGLVVGSIPAIYPGFRFTLGGLVSIVLLVVGVVASYLLAKHERN